jgi:hypothetical protein
MQRTQSQAAALLRSLDRFASGALALGGLLLTVEGLTPDVADEAWRQSYAAAVSELKVSYDSPSEPGGLPPTMANDEVAETVARIRRLLESATTTAE